MSGLVSSVGHVLSVSWISRPMQLLWSDAHIGGPRTLGVERAHLACSVVACDALLFHDAWKWMSRASLSTGPTTKLRNTSTGKLHFHRVGVSVFVSSPMCHTFFQHAGRIVRIRSVPSFSRDRTFPQTTIACFTLSRSDGKIDVISVSL